MFEWTPDMIRFMRDASEYGGYHDALAQKIAAHLPPQAHVCDAGCGLGYLSLALAQHAQRVTAVDIAPLAISVLQHSMEQRNIANIQTVCADIGVCNTQQKYDAMVLCFFGSVADTLRIAKEQCSGTVVMIKRDWVGHRFSTEHMVIRHTIADAEAQLSALGIPHTSERFALRMDQPFRSMEDAEAFFKVYGRGAPKFSRTELVSRLVAQEDDEFPYRYPMENRLGMLVLRAGDIPAIQ
jgi:SAM-dependent methyltransferase